ncbi:MAG: hypothetical protein U9Q40_05610 [Campylobacterota bacterium]|nr:hypothetical protein [Campylobacterota bacterium]
MTIAEWIKANTTLKEGVDIKEVDGLIADLDPLKNLETIDQALSFMDRNDLFKRALKKNETQAIEKHDKKFMETKFPELMKEEREKIVKELNPEETAQDKEIRELKQWKLDTENANKKRILEAENLAALKDKAKEIGYDGDIERYSRLSGENAIEYMLADHKVNTEYKEKLKKEVYGDNKPPSKSEEENTDYDLDSEMGKLSFLNQ